MTTDNQQPTVCWPMVIFETATMALKIAILIFDKMVVLYWEHYDVPRKRNLRLPDKVLDGWAREHPLAMYLIAGVLRHKLSRRWFVEAHLQYQVFEWYEPTQNMKWNKISKEFVNSQLEYLQSIKKK